LPVLEPVEQEAARLVELFRPAVERLQWTLPMHPLPQVKLVWAERQRLDTSVIVFVVSVWAPAREPANFTITVNLDAWPSDLPLRLGSLPDARERVGECLFHTLWQAVRGYCAGDALDGKTIEVENAKTERLSRAEYRRSFGDG
jgi:hypothetical protein